MLMAVWRPSVLTEEYNLCCRST